ncbi:hypothetical protein [Novosphingobium sp.]|uniref:hypothetical protein n=1 Tax=Novosphingobium sp. TaxID=1874826 RepID=UPI0038BA7EC2
MTAAVPILRRLWPYAALVAALLLAWHYRDRTLALSEAMTAQAARFTQAQDDARSAWTHEKARLEFRSRVDAQESDRRYAQALAENRAITAAFAAAHGLRAAPAARDASGTRAAAEDHGAGLPAELPAAPVVVAAVDLQACTAAVTYAEAAHDWAVGLAQPSDDR